MRKYTEPEVVRVKRDPNGSPPESVEAAIREIAKLERERYCFRMEMEARGTGEAKYRAWGRRISSLEGWMRNQEQRVREKSNVALFSDTAHAFEELYAAGLLGEEHMELLARLRNRFKNSQM